MSNAPESFSNAAAANMFGSAVDDGDGKGAQEEADGSGIGFPVAPVAATKKCTFPLVCNNCWQPIPFHANPAVSFSCT